MPDIHFKVHCSVISEKLIGHAYNCDNKVKHYEVKNLTFFKHSVHYNRFLQNVYRAWSVH